MINSALPVESLGHGFAEEFKQLAAFFGRPL
jgi:hypothetical protein